MCRDEHTYIYHTDVPLTVCTHVVNRHPAGSVDDVEKPNLQSDERNA